MQKAKKGFTLIEIVIVLAIAALIMVIVFLAVQGAQRSRRDTQRKNDANRVLALAENFASTNSGNYPSTAAQCGSFITNYITKEGLTNPSGGAYDLGTTCSIPASAITNISAPNLYFSSSATCKDGAMTGTGASARQFAVQIGLETGTYCINN